jgi:hypothetical protein
MFDFFGALVGLGIAAAVLLLVGVAVGGTLLVAALFVAVVFGVVALGLLLPVIVPVAILVLMIALPVWLIARATRSASAPQRTALSVAPVTREPSRIIVAQS